jgi:hypothetical protein
VTPPAARGYHSLHMRALAAVASLAAALSVGAGVAAAATAPSASTGPVTSVGATSATVSGSVNPNGTSTSWHVEYGTSTSYGSSTGSTSAGSGTSSVPISATLSGLKAGTTYHYRVVATSSAGTARGADGIVTTAAAPQVVIGSATASATSATLNGTVDPSGRATTWYFEYGTSTSYGHKTPAKDAGSGNGAVAVSAPISGLTAGRTYHYRLVASSDAGTSRGSDRTFVATNPPTVTTKSASSIRDTSATLNASVNPNGQSTTVYFEYGTSTSYGSKSSSKSIGSGGSTTNVAIGVSGLTPGVVYHFRVVASNATGTNAGADQAFTTSGQPVVRTGSVTGVSSSGATLTGIVDPNGHAATWFFQYGLTASYGLQTPVRSGSGGSRTVSEPIGGLLAGRTYHMRLVASNSIGTSYGADVAFTTAGPLLTIAASTTTVISHRAVMLTGKVATGKSDEPVALYAQRYGAGSFTQLTTVLTDAGGTWRLIVRPLARTTYKGVWNGQSSATVTVAVRPAVSLRVLPQLRFATHVAGARSFAGRIVQLQRHLLNGGWVTIARARLNSSSNAVFRPHLRVGRSTLRVAISVNQTGPGYVAGYSRWVSVRRR